MPLIEFMNKFAELNCVILLTVYALDAYIIMCKLYIMIQKNLKISLNRISVYKKINCIEYNCYKNTYINEISLRYDPSVNMKLFHLLLIHSLLAIREY